MELKQILAHFNTIENYTLRKQRHINAQMKKEQRKIIQEGHNIFKDKPMANPDKINKQALKYVQSHHPFIKNRIIKIASRINSFQNETKTLNKEERQNSICKVPNTYKSRKASLSTISFFTQNENNECKTPQYSFNLYTMSYSEQSHVKQALQNYQLDHTPEIIKDKLPIQKQVNNFVNHQIRSNAQKQFRQKDQKNRIQT